MIEFKIPEGFKVIELGGGGNPRFHPNVDARQCYAATGVPTVDFTADFTQLLPIQSEEWDAVYCAFALEHLPANRVPGFLSEVFRILKKGGTAVFAIPNTPRQFEWIMNNPSGWDGKSKFVAASEVLYGTQDYTENAHHVYFDEQVVFELFHAQGFGDIKCREYNERKTDMVVTAVKPLRPYNAVEGCGWATGELTWDGQQANMVRPPQVNVNVFGTNAGPAEYPGNLSQPDGPHERGGEEVPRVGDLLPGKVTLMGGQLTASFGGPPPSAIVSGPSRRELEVGPERAEREKMECQTTGGWERFQESAKAQEAPPEELYDKHYFNGGGKVGGYAREGYWDYPVHETTVKHILARRPESVLELGCARGYILKRLQDQGIPAVGIEVSKHCYLTRVCDGIYNTSVSSTPWFSEVKHVIPTGLKIDLCYSVAVLEHIPEQYLPAVICEMSDACKRGLHGIDFGEHDDGFDKTHCTLKPREWWLKLFAEHAPNWPVEIIDKEELERGGFPPELLRGDDGLVKLNIGCFTTMFHRNWTNVDVHDLAGWAQQYGYNYVKHDVRSGLAYQTGTVDLIYCCHMLEHLTYEEGLKFLRECRRVLKPDTGAMRVIVPDMGELCRMYADEGYTRTKLHDFDEINDGCAQSKTPAGKLWNLMAPGHQSGYDAETLQLALENAGFMAFQGEFRRNGIMRTDGGGLWFHPGQERILKETLDMLPCISLYYDAVPDAV